MAPTEGRVASTSYFNVRKTGYLSTTFQLTSNIVVMTTLSSFAQYRRCSPMKGRDSDREFYLPRLIEPGLTSPQHSIGYMGDGFTGQKTQPTVSKY